MYNIEFTKAAKNSIAKYKKSQPYLYKKIDILLHELMEHPRTGIGHPEPLVGGNGITYSRRISPHDRLIYDINDDVVTVLVLSVAGHYNDK